MVRRIAGLLFLFFTLFFAGPAIPASAQIVVIPDCELFPHDPFCIKSPIVFVPGLVASYNRKVLFKDKPGGTWSFVPFGNIYAGLLARLRSPKNAANGGVYVAYYDWRQSNEKSASEYLAPVIAAAKQHSATGRVDIVAHSMGGLVAQEYIKSDLYTPGEIDHFIMLGTPNEGASDAYLPWEGGILPGRWGIVIRSYINAIEVSLKKVKEFNARPPLTYREFFPSLKELLPTKEFITKNGDPVPRGDLSEQNPFLAALNDFHDTLLNGSDLTVTTIAGTERDTINTIPVGDSRTEEDISLERWRDGHPVEEVPSPNSTEGDETVLSSSALLGDNTVTLPGVSHTALPEAAQDEVLTALGYPDDNPKQFLYKEPQWLTGFVVLSPVDIVITDSHGKTVSKDTNDFGDDAFVDIDEGDGEDDPKVIILQNLPPGIYTVHLTGTDTGPYTVITTHADNSTTSSETLTGTTTPGKQEEFTVTITDEGMSASPLTSITPPSGSSGGGRGDEQDCCPGPDNISSKKPGKVLGATVKKAKKVKGPVTLEELKPLNDIFFSVYGRIPTFQEWKYWAKRYEKDKRDWVQLQGAMYWHKARNITH